MNKRLRLEHLIAALLSGFLLAVAFPKWDLTWLLFVALIPLFWAVQGKSLKAAFGLGFLAGLVRYVVLLYWIVYVTHVHGFLPLPLAIGILLLLAAYLSLYPALLGPGGQLGRGPGPEPGLVGAGPLGQPRVRPDLHHQRLSLGTPGQRPGPASHLAPGRRPHRGLRPLLPAGLDQCLPVASPLPAPVPAPPPLPLRRGRRPDPGGLAGLRLLPPG